MLISNLSFRRMQDQTVKLRTDLDLAGQAAVRQPLPWQQ
jgi:hypothetical protein